MGQSGRPLATAAAEASWASATASPFAAEPSSLVPPVALSSAASPSAAATTAFLPKNAASSLTLKTARSRGMDTHSTVQLNMTGDRDLRARTWVQFRTTWALVMMRLPETRKPVPDEEDWVLVRQGSA